MSLKRIFFNILLAVMVALPLAAIESRFNVERPDYFLGAERPDYFVQNENNTNDHRVEASELKVNRTDKVAATAKATVTDEVAATDDASQLVELVSDKTDKHLTRPRARTRFDVFIHQTADKYGVSPALVKRSSKRNPISIPMSSPRWEQWG